MPDIINKSPESFNFVRTRDWVNRIAAAILADARETAMTAAVDALNDPALHDRVSQLVRDEFAQREQDLIQQVFTNRT